MNIESARKPTRVSYLHSKRFAFMLISTVCIDERTDINKLMPMLNNCPYDGDSRSNSFCVALRVTCKPS